MREKLTAKELVCEYLTIAAVRGAERCSSAEVVRVREAIREELEELVERGLIVIQKVST